MKGSTCYIFGFMITVLSPGVIAGYLIGYQNQLTDCFEEKFGWKTENEKALWEGILGGSVILGAALGSFSGGKAMAIGRRKMLMISMLIAILGNLLSIYLNEYSLTFAKFLFGLGVGLYCPIIPKMIEETVPAHLFEPLITSYLLA